MSKLLCVTDYLGPILQANERIDRYATGLDEDSFLQSDLVQDAVIRSIAIIGEASNNVQRVNAEFAANHCEIPWEVMYGMRNRVSHAYHKVDMEVVWRTIQNELPGLYKLIQEAVDDAPGEPSTARP